MRWLNVFLLICVLLLTSIDYSSSLKGMVDVAEGADTSAELTTLHQGVQDPDNEERHILLESFRRFFYSIERRMKLTFVDVTRALHRLYRSKPNYFTTTQYFLAKGRNKLVTVHEDAVKELFLSKDFQKWADIYGSERPADMVKALHSFFTDEGFIRVMDVVLNPEVMSSGIREWWSKAMFHFFRKYEKKRISAFNELDKHIGIEKEETLSYKAYDALTKDSEFTKSVDDQYASFKKFRKDPK